MEEQINRVFQKKKLIFILIIQLQQEQHPLHTFVQKHMSITRPMICSHSSLIMFPKSHEYIQFGQSDSGMLWQQMKQIIQYRNIARH